MNSIVVPVLSVRRRERFNFRSKTVSTKLTADEFAELETCMADRVSAIAVTTTFQFGPQAPQHFLYFLPLPQGQGSFRPSLGACDCIVFPLEARRYNRCSRAWRLAKREFKSGRTFLSASTNS